MCLGLSIKEHDDLWALSSPRQQREQYGRVPGSHVGAQQTALLSSLHLTTAKKEEALLLHLLYPSLFWDETLFWFSSN